LSNNGERRQTKTAANRSGSDWLLCENDPIDHERTMCSNPKEDIMIHRAARGSALAFLLIAALLAVVQAAQQELVPLNQVFRETISGLTQQANPHVQILRQEEAVKLLNEFEVEFKKLSTAMPETQAHSNQVVFDGIERARKDPYQVEPVARVCSVMEKLIVVITVKRDFDTATRLSNINDKLTKHMLDVAQLKDRIVDTATVLRTRSAATASPATPKSLEK